MAVDSDYLRYAANAERNGTTPTQAAYSASKQLANTAANTLPEENIAANYQATGLKPVVPAKQPSSPAVPTGGLLNESVKEAVKAKYGSVPFERASAIKQGLETAKKELGDYGESFKNVAGEYAEQGKKIAGESFGNIKQGLRTGGALGLRKAIAKEGIKAASALGRTVLPTAEDVSEFTQALSDIKSTPSATPIAATSAAPVSKTTPINKPATTKVETPTMLAEAGKTAIPAISETAKAPEYTAEQVEEFSKGGTDQAVSKGKGGNFRYVIDVKGQPVKQNLDTGEIVPMAGGITRNIIKPGEEGPIAKSVREKKERAYHDALVQMATMPITGQTDIGDIAGIKARRKAALAMLGEEAANQRAAQQAGLEERKIGATERHALATEEANKLSAQQRADYQRGMLKTAEERNRIAAETKANAPRKITYKGKTIEGTPDAIELEKTNIDKKLIASYDNENPMPTSWYSSDEDVNDWFTKRNEKLGFDTNIGQARLDAKAVSDYWDKMTPEDKAQAQTEFQRQYGIPYTSLIK